MNTVLNNSKKIVRVIRIRFSLRKIKKILLTRMIVIIKLLKIIPELKPLKIIYHNPNFSSYLNLVQ